MADVSGAVEVRRPAVYIRWSTEDQGEGTTLDVQLEGCRTYIMSQGWPYQTDAVFIDDGISGATLDRPALSRLRAAIVQGDVDCVVVYKLDRLSRSVLDMLKLVLEEWDGRCCVKSAREPIDTLTPTGKLFFYQLMSFAEWERSVIRDRTFAGKLRRAAEGRSPGLTLPYGFRRGPDGRIEQDPAAAAVVRRIFQFYLSGLGCKAIARELDREGCPPARGAHWSQPTVGDMLRNPAYRGALVYGRTKVLADGRRVAREPLLTREGFYPAIVTAAEFEAVRRLRAERPGPGRGQGTGRSLGGRSLLTGLLRCRCGQACTGRELRAKGHPYRYYICTAVQKTGAGRCGAGNIRQSDLDGLVVRQLLALCREDGARARLAAKLTEGLGARRRETQVAREAADRELRRLEEREQRLRGWLLDGQLTPAEYRSLGAELSEKLQAARAARDAAARAEAGAQAALEREAESARVASRISEWETLTLPEQKQLLRQFITGVTVYRDRATNELSCDITWRWDEPTG